MEGQTMSSEVGNCRDGPAALVAITRAARGVGDRDLERAARRELAERYGIELRFRRTKKEPLRETI